MRISRRKLEAEAVAGGTGEEQAAGVTVVLARAVRLIGDSQSATVWGYNKNTMRYSAIKPTAR